MNLELEGKTALVTGASRGMGKAIAARLAAEGAHVAICGRSFERIMKAAEDIVSETGHRPIALVCDLSDARAIGDFVSDAVEALGGVDILVSNAGGPPRGDFVNLTDEDWAHWFNLMFMSFVRLTRAVIPLMQARGGGHILTIGSNSTVQPIADFPLSNALRAGILGLVRSLVEEIGGSDIRITMLSPGRIATERFLANAERLAEAGNIPPETVRRNIEKTIPLSRLGTPQEIADLVAFMVSGRARYLTGNNILLDGGLTAAARPS